MRRHAEPLPFTQLHRHEVRNAIRLAVWRQAFDTAKRREVLRLIEEDLSDGILVHQPVNWTKAFREADRIGESQTELTGLRSADLLHLGIATLMGADEFLTFDAIQRKAAIGMGIRCKLR